MMTHLHGPCVGISDLMRPEAFAVISFDIKLSTRTGVIPSFSIIKPAALVLFNVNKSYEEL